ncbi:uncharacterized protein KY384_003358 [Bacidia gigantensis]|uniref:uncharacterized protein n=1 Tax=Bacidia gigantensis TaxID=2732470 RepID=UPI001D0530D3|nr:uncharacterized protein KY384_003358 [Bacidia gigantensis]KAG8531726.1 hypothetical protein KY384_003358 [Bacidia gigantensis]
MSESSSTAKQKAPKHTAIWKKDRSELIFYPKPAYTNVQLKQMLKDRGLKTSGNKALPPEIRNIIYTMVAGQKGYTTQSNIKRRWVKAHGSTPTTQQLFKMLNTANIMQPSIFRLCTQTRREGLPIFLRDHEFNIALHGLHKTEWLGFGPYLSRQPFDGSWGGYPTTISAHLPVDLTTRLITQISNFIANVPKDTQMTFQLTGIRALTKLWDKYLKGRCQVGGRTMKLRMVFEGDGGFFVEDVTPLPSDVESIALRSDMLTNVLIFPPNIS